MSAILIMIERARLYNELRIAWRVVFILNADNNLWKRHDIEVFEFGLTDKFVLEVQ